MKILHLFGNWKWTGPADPAVSLAAAQDCDAAVSLVVGPCPFPDLQNRVALEARGRGLDPLVDRSLGKHLNALRLPSASRSLSHIIDRMRPDVVHVHLDADHATAALTGKRAHHPVLVRTFYEGTAVASGLRRRLLLRFATDAALVVSPAARVELSRAWPRGEARLRLIEGGVDLERFSPTAKARRRGRVLLGLGPDQVAVGVVARVQRHRRYELLLGALARAHHECPNLVLVVLGRGTRFDELVARPAGEMGLREQIRLPGYLDGAPYVDALAALDAAVYLVPGTDGSCRAVREEMAMGLPVIVSQTPPLPDLVGDGRGGLVTALEEVDLAAALMRLARDAAGRLKMGEGARRKARERFGWKKVAGETLSFYDSLLSRGGGALR